jgi:hypothetical protein
MKKIIDLAVFRSSLVKYSAVLLGCHILNTNGLNRMYQSRCFGADSRDLVKQPEREIRAIGFINVGFSRM